MIEATTTLRQCLAAQARLAIDERAVRRRKALLRGQLGTAGHGPAFERALDIAARASLAHESACQESARRGAAARAAFLETTEGLASARQREEDARHADERAKAQLVELARRDFRVRLARPWAPRRIRPVQVRRARRRPATRSARSLGCRRRATRPTATAAGDPDPEPDSDGSRTLFCSPGGAS